MGCRHVSRSKSQGRTSMFKLSIPPWVQSLRWTHLFQEIKAIVCPLMSFNQIEMTSFYRKNFCKKEGHWRRRPPCLIFFLRKNFWWSHCGKSYFFPPPLFLHGWHTIPSIKKKKNVILDLLTRLSLSPSEFFFVKQKLSIFSFFSYRHLIRHSIEHFVSSFFITKRNQQQETSSFFIVRGEGVKWCITAYHCIGLRELVFNSREEKREEMELILQSFK